MSCTPNKPTEMNDTISSKTRAWGPASLQTFSKSRSTCRIIEKTLAVHFYCERALATRTTWTAL